MEEKTKDKWEEKREREKTMKNEDKLARIMTYKK